MSATDAFISTSDQENLLSDGAELWQSLRGKRLFLTGGTGFFGKWLAQALLLADARLNLGLDLWLLSRDPEAAQRAQPWLSGPCLRWARGDVRDFAIPETRFDLIIHGATASTAALYASRPREMADTIVRGTDRVLELAARSGKPKFLFVSSGAVYGPQPASIAHVDEAYLGAPDISNASAAYGEGKRMAELAAQLGREAGQIELSVARCFAFVGPYLPLDTHFAAGNFVRDLLARQPLVLQGDGRPYRSYMYPTDLVLWLLTILLRAPNGGVYNVGSDDDRPLGDLAQTLDAQREAWGIPLLGSGPGVVIRGRSGEHGAAKSAPRNGYVPSIDKAKRELGLHIRVDTEAAFRRTIDWHRDNELRAARGTGNETKHEVNS